MQVVGPAGIKRCLALKTAEYGRLLVPANEYLTSAPCAACKTEQPSSSSRVKDCPDCGHTLARDWGNAPANLLERTLGLGLDGILRLHPVLFAALDPALSAELARRRAAPAGNDHG